MANLLSFVKRVANTVNNDVVKPIQRDVVHPVAQAANTVYHGVSPFDNGQGWTNQAPQRPQAPYQAPQAGGLQVRPVQTPTITPFHVAPTANLQVHVAAPQPLQVGNQTIQPNPNARSGVAPPPIRGNAGNYAHGLGLGILGGAEQAAANTARGLTDLRFLTPNFVPGVSSHIDPFIHNISNKIAAPFQAGQQGFQRAIKQEPTVAAQKGAKVGNIVGQSAIYAPQAPQTAEGVVQLAKQVPRAIEAGGQVISKANELRTPLNAVGSVGKNMPQDFLNQDPKVVAQNARILQTSKAKAAAALDKNVLPEDKATVNQRLSKIPAIPEVPSTSAKPGQVLNPTQNLPLPKKLFANKVTALRQINTPSSHIAADKMVSAEADRQAMQAQWMHSIPTVRSLSKNEFGNFVDTVEKTAKAQSSKVAQAAKEWKALTPKIAKTGESQGFLLNGARQDYFPHQYDVIKEGTTKWDNQIQSLMDTRKINHETAVNILKSHNDNVKAGFAGSLENSRETTLPGYHKDIHAVNSYIGRAASRVADARQFGNDAQIANKLVENVRIEGGDANSAEAALRNYLTSPDKGGAGSKALSGARGVFGAASLSKAFISHLGQTSNTAVEAGVGRTLKGWGQFLSRNSEAKNFVDKTGVANPQELHSYRNQYTSLKGAMSKVTAAGLTPVMKMNRSVTALAGREYGSYLAKTGNEAALRELGVTGNVGKTLTKPQEVQAARGLSNHTMFSGSRSTTPIYAETPTGKTVGQFRTAYAYKQTGFLYNQVIKAAQKGDLKPLARFLGVSTPIAGGTIAIKNKLSGKKEGPGGIAMDVLGALGGIPGELAVQGARYGSRAGNLTQTVAGAVAPLAGEAMTVGGNIDSLLHGKPKPLERTALSAIPLAGGRISKALLPPKTGPNAPNASNVSASQQQKIQKAGINPSSYVNDKGFKPNVTPTGKHTPPTQGELTALSPDELTRWQGMTAKARANVKLNNPDKYVRDQNLQIAQEQAQGKTIQAFKDNRAIQKTQVQRNFDKNIVGAYGLNATDFKAFVAQASPDQINQLHSLDNQLVSSGLVANSKFPKAKSSTGRVARSSSGRRSTGTRTIKTARAKAIKVPSFKIKGATAFKPPKGVKVKKLATFKQPKTRKLAVSKLPKIG